MNKLMQAKQLLGNLKNEAKELASKDDVTTEELNAKTAEIEKVQAKISALEASYDEDENDENENDENENVEPLNNSKNENNDQVVYENAFTKKIRNMCLKEDYEKVAYTKEEIQALSSNTDSDGKLLIPQKITTKIQELKREFLDMYDYVNVEPISTASGHRPIETDAIHTPLEGVAELVSIPDMGSPKFAKIEFNAKDFKGLIDIPNSLLKDETADLMGYLAKWIAKKIVATHNALIFYADGAKGAEGILGVKTDGFTFEILDAPIDQKKVKNIFNVKLPSTIAKNAVLFTNQSGFDYLEGLEDKQGRSYLEELGDNRYKLDKKTLTINKFDDKTLLTDTDGKVPFIFGNAREGITYFDREKMSLASSSEAGFENDSTKVRVITRGDVRQVDKKALYIVYAPIV